MINKKSSKIKILFFGLGSIGTKHASIIKDNFGFKLYAYRTNKGQEKNELNIVEFDNIKDAFSIKPEIAFITNPTFLHTETALECAKRNIALFIEKPISHSLEGTSELEKEIKKRNVFTYIAYNVRFHPIITNLKDLISSEKEKPIYFRSICSSYLPNWRPGQNYSRSYSAKKDSGGGVILDLSHEIDYITWLFGEVKNINGYCGKVSNLNIDSEDILDVQITCDSNIKGNLHLDYFSRKNERKSQIYYNDKYLEGDLIKNTIKIIKDGKERMMHHKCNMDDTYRMQLEYFFEQYFNKNPNVMNNYSEALKTFKKIMEFKNKSCKI